jgi:thioredoxin reductase (NADPH)
MPSSSQPGAPNGETDTTALLAFLHQSGKAQTLAPDEVLFREGTPCTGAYFVEEGALELTLASGDRRMHVGSAHPGQLVGITSVLADEPSQSTATAMLKSKVVFVEAELFRKYLKTHPDICLHAVQSLGSDIVDLALNAIRPMRLRSRYHKSH